MVKRILINQKKAECGIKEITSGKMCTFTVAEEQRALLSDLVHTNSHFKALVIWLPHVGGAAL